MAKHIGRQVSLFRRGYRCRRAVADRLCTGNAKFLFLFAAAAAGLTAYFLRNFTPDDNETAQSAKGTTAMGGGQGQEVLMKTVVSLLRLIRLNCPM